jgi:sterol desaturase/sphingolipid hydroxylase (fatty acid hydroxylase superfamily)
MAIPRAHGFALFSFGTLAIASGYFVVEYLPHSSLVALYTMTRGTLLKINTYFVSLLEIRIFALSFWCAIVLTLGLQRLLPAKQAQKIFSIGFAQDAVWFFYETLLNALILVFYVEYLTRYYHQYFSRLTITSLSQSPGWARFLLALLLVDFLYWLQHYCLHKSPLLWRFHALHHSQKELNYFTDFRYHVVEYVVRYTFLIIPFLILQLDPPTIAAFVIFQRCYSHFYHGNIRTNLGPLKYLLVTPQSHRVHHSLEAEHQDQNFGAIFSVWDFILGTQCKTFTAYPETGIADEAFPHEREARLKSLLLTPLSQLLYPFLVTVRADASLNPTFRSERQGSKVE